MRCDICDGTTMRSFGYPGATLFVCEKHRIQDLDLRPKPDFEIERGEWWVTQKLP